MKGRLEDMAVADIIQHNCHSRNAARVEFKSDRQRAELYFKNGNVVHASMNRDRGEEVVYRLLGWEEGHFNVQMDVAPPEISISKSWSSLLLEGMRRLDEGEQDETRPSKPVSSEDRHEDLALYSPLYVPVPTTEEGLDETPDTTHDGTSLQQQIQEMGALTEGMMLAALADINGAVLASASAAGVHVSGTLQQASHFLRTISKAVKRLGAGQMEDNLLTTETAVLVARFLDDEETFLLLAANKSAANLGNMRHLVEVYEKKLSRMDISKQTEAIQ